MTANENINPVPEDQNNVQDAECDFDTFVEFCDGNTAVYCDVDENKVNRWECEDEEENQCMTTIGLYTGEYEGKNYVGCYKSCEGPAVDSSCEEYTGYVGGVLWSNYCLKTSEGYLYFETEDEQTCDTPCNEDGDACEELDEIPEGQSNVEDEGCDLNTFVASCDGNTAVLCDEGQVSRVDCGERVCLTTKGVYEENTNHAECFARCSDYETGDVCDSELSVSYYAECTYTSKGWLELRFDQISCAHGCDADGLSCAD